MPDFWSLVTLHHDEIVDRGPFCEVILCLHLPEESAWGLFRQSRKESSERDMRITPTVRDNPAGQRLRMEMCEIE
jgi:hypothetical protein